MLNDLFTSKKSLNAADLVGDIRRLLSTVDTSPATDRKGKDGRRVSPSSSEARSKAGKKSAEKRAEAKKPTPPAAPKEEPAAPREEPQSTPPREEQRQDVPRKPKPLVNAESEQARRLLALALALLPSERDWLIEQLIQSRQQAAS